MINQHSQATISFRYSKVYGYQFIVRSEAELLFTICDKELSVDFFEQCHLFITKRQLSKWESYAEWKGFHIMHQQIVKQVTIKEFVTVLN